MNAAADAAPGPAAADLLASDPGDTRFLLDEVARRHPGAAVETVVPGLVRAAIPGGAPALPFAFARQVLPAAVPFAAASIRLWAEGIASALVGAFPDDPPWRLHLWPAYGEGSAGQHRCELVRAALDEQLQRRRRHLRRRLVESRAPFAPGECLAQVMLTAPDAGFVSLSRAPRPHALRAGLSAFPGGWIPVASDKAAPSRAFAKLVEAEQRLGRAIAAGETCVDLGACPGSWTYVAARRGARVTSVDRTPVRDDLLRDPRVTFVRGDAFKFRPEAPVDWLVCDVIAAPRRSIDLALEWAANRWARHLVVTIKFKGTDEYPLLDELLPLAARCSEFRLARLCANKNEACVAATLSDPAPAAAPTA